jgi:hypothetical protein
MIAAVDLYGLVDARLPGAGTRQQVLVFYTSREAAEKALCGVLRDEPSWYGDISVKPFPLVPLPPLPLSLN